MVLHKLTAVANVNLRVLL